MLDYKSYYSSMNKMITISLQLIFIVLWYKHYSWYYPDVVNTVPCLYLLFMVSPYFKFELAYKLTMIALMAYIAYKQPETYAVPTYYITSIVLTAIISTVSNYSEQSIIDLVTIVTGILIITLFSIYRALPTLRHYVYTILFRVIFVIIH